MIVMGFKLLYTSHIRWNQYCILDSSNESLCTIIHKDVEFFYPRMLRSLNRTFITQGFLGIYCFTT